MYSYIYTRLYTLHKHIYPTRSHLFFLLDIQSNSRVPGELDYFSDRWGGLLRQQAVIHTSTAGDTVSYLSLKSFIHSMSPLLKEDETELCPLYDGVVTSRPPECDEAPYNTSTIYCTCDTIAASPHQIKLELDLDNGGKINITEKHLCSTQPVPAEFKPATHVSYHFDDVRLISSPLYAPALATARAVQISGSLEADPVFTAEVAAAITACETAISANEATFTALQLRSDLANSTLECYNAIVETVFGPAFSLDEDGTLLPAGLESMWAQALITPDDTAALELAYQNGGGAAGDAPDAAATYTATADTVFSAARGISTSVAAAFIAVRYNFITENTLMSYGFGEIGQCVAEYEKPRRTQFLANVLNETLADVAATDNRSAFWDIPALYAAIDVGREKVEEGANLASDLLPQFAVLRAYFQAAVEPINSTAYDYVIGEGFTPDDNGMDVTRVATVDAFLRNLQITQDPDFPDSFATELAAAYKDEVPAVPLTPLRTPVCTDSELHLHSLPIDTHPTIHTMPHVPNTQHSWPLRCVCNSQTRDVLPLHRHPMPRQMLLGLAL
eukprot:m.89688 g.89688  ORF g.89688 m.89688 type:complete len:560 (+) comp12902_c0_seq6:382-2061(+)